MQHPVGQLPTSAIAIPKSHAKAIVRWATLVTHARAEIKRELIDREWEPVSAGTPEGPFKVINYFKDLARGHALIHGRLAVDETDLALIGEVAISSIPGHPRPLIRALRTSETVNTKEAVHLCNVSETTARRYLDELPLLGIAAHTKGSPLTNLSSKITLTQQFQWLRDLESKV